MQVLVTYDISVESEGGPKRLRRVAQVCKNFGQRVQKSVFECSIDEMQYERMVNELVRIIEKDVDSVRFYRIREPKKKNVKAIGVSEVVDFDEPLMV